MHGARWQGRCLFIGKGRDLHCGPLFLTFPSSADRCVRTTQKGILQSFLAFLFWGPCGYLMNVMAQNNINASNKVLREISYDEILLSKYYNRIVYDIVTHVLLCYYIR